MIVTDGIGDEWRQNTVALRNLAKTLKAKQVELLVVAIGNNVKLDEFKEIASGEKTVYNPKRFNDLQTLYKEVAFRSCKGKIEPFQCKRCDTTANRHMMSVSQRTAR